MPAASDAEMLLYYTLDESQPATVRANLGSLGSTHDLSVTQSTGTDGIPTVADGNGGRALDLFITRSGWTSAQRGLAGTAYNPGSGHPCLLPLPIASSANDFTFGCRFQFRGLNTGGGGIEEEHVWGLKDFPAGAVTAWGVSLDPNDATSPTAARVTIRLANTALPLSGGSWTITGSPPSYYVLVNGWYRLLVRVYFDTAGYKVKAYLVEESTGTIYTWTLNAAVTTDYGSSVTAATALRLWIGEWGSTHFPLGGYIDDCWLYDAGMTDAEATSAVIGGFTVPWDPPSYRTAQHVVYAAVTRDGASFPPTRALPTGTRACRYPADVLAQRLRVRIEGWRPGRPWLCRSIEGTFDSAGPYSGKPGNRWAYEDLNLGLYRMGGQLPAGAWEDVRNVESTVIGPRRRRGFRIRRNVSTAQGDASDNAFFFFRTNDLSLYGLYKVGAGLYEETGAAALLLDSGWNPQQRPSFMFLDDRAIILSSLRRKTWRGTTGSIESFGIAAGSTANVVTGAGGTLAGTYYYAWTEYDPTTGDESAPKVSTSVTPATQKVTLTMDAVNSDTRFSQRRIYRTTNGGSPPDLFLIATITSATTYADTGVADGTQAVGQVTDTSGTLLAYITGSPPDTFAFGCVHMERAFYAGGTTYPERVYVSEANNPQRWYPNFYITAENVVRAVVSWGHRLVIFTDSTVEIVESDWARDGDGNVNVQRTVVSRTVGALGFDSVRVIEGNLYWIDRRAVWTMRGTEPVPLSGPIRDLFPYINHAVSRRARVSFNHLRRQVWISVPHSTLQTDSGRFQTILVLDLDAYSAGTIKWSIYELEASHHGPYDDDLNGLQFGLIDHLGVFKQAESYEGDGAQGNESYTTEDEGGAAGNVGIQSISGSVVTVYGAPGWTSGALRGMALVLRDRSTGLLYWYPISTNTTTTITVVGTPNAALAARDGYYVGGIRAWVQYAEQGFGTPNEKVVRYLHLEFADLTQTSLYL